MTLIIIGFVVGAALLMLLIWLFVAQQELSGKWKALQHAAADLNLHRSLYESERDGPQREQAARMLEISRRLYGESQRVYQSTLQTPLCRIPGALLGFRADVKEAEL